MTALSIVALVVSAVCGTLAAVAIYFSFAFYRMAAQSAEQARQAEQTLVVRVQQLDDRIVALNREAIPAANRSDQSAGRQVGPLAPSPAPDLDDKLAAVKREILAGLSALLTRAKREPGGSLAGQPGGQVVGQHVGDAPSAEAMSTEMADIIDRAIAQSRGMP